jgi:hypothetical protein
MSNLTPNKNYLSPTGFKVTINSSQFANMEYFCIKTSVPMISLSEVSLPYKSMPNYVSGERLEWSPFEMTFQVSEFLENYLELYNWITKNSQIDQFVKSDMILSILDSHNNVSKQIRYVDAFPVSVGYIELHTQNTDVEYVTVDASFRYSYFEFL